jgi:hypothetical protein
MKNLRLTCLPLLLLLACSDDDDDTSDGPAPTADAAVPTVDSAVPGPDAATLDCDSPFALPLDPEAETRARAALTALAPAAKLTWSPTRGTLSDISDVAIEVPGCTGETNAYEALFALLEATPALFQIDRDDWRTDFPVTCASIGASNTTLVIRRIKFGPLVLVNDVFAAAFKKIDDKIVLSFVGATYIPTPSPAILAQLQGCADRPTAEIEADLRAKPFAYANFDPPPAPICSLGDPGSYTAVPADTLTFASESELFWDDAEVVTIRRVRAATLLVAPAGITPELERSSANCPDDNAEPRVGWIRYFDPVSGTILFDKANPVEGCIVC